MRARAELVVLVAGDVRLQEREVVGVARNQGQVLDLVLGDGPADVDLAGARDRRFSGDRDGLGHHAGFKRRVHHDVSGPRRG